MSDAILETIHLFADEPAEVEPSHEEQDFANLAALVDSATCDYCHDMPEECVCDTPTVEAIR